MNTGRVLLGVILCVFLSVVFVASLYLWVKFDPKLKRLNRDHPRVIKLRTISVVLASLVACSVTYMFSGSLGIKTTNVGFLAMTAAQTLVLMLGPVVDQWSRLTKVPSLNLQFGRTVVVAPIFEELVFRACFHQILVTSGLNDFVASSVSPFFFALAHVHHHVGRNSPMQIVSQIVHTCLFGWLGGYFLISRSLWDAILAHAICNYIGLPSDSTKSPRIRISLYAVGLVTFLGSIFL